MSEISLLPGWAMAPATMQPLREALLERLPGYLVNCHALPAIQLSSMEPDLAALAEALPPGVLVGWSLGGMLALQLQRRYPERFSAVITIASNACFVTRQRPSSVLPCWLPRVAPSGAVWATRSSGMRLTRSSDCTAWHCWVCWIIGCHWRATQRRCCTAWRVMMRWYLSRWRTPWVG